MFAQCRACIGGGGWLRKGQPAIAESPRPTETPLAKAQQQDVETPATVEVDKTRKSMTPLRSLRKQASRLSGVTGAFSGKSPERPANTTPMPSADSPASMTPPPPAAQ